MVKRNTVPKADIIYHQVSIFDMINQLRVNPARASQTYKGKYVDFDGIIDVIDADGNYFSVNTNSFLQGIKCNMHNVKHQKIIVNKNIGDRIHVKGQVKDVGEILGYSIDVLELQ